MKKRLTKKDTQLVEIVAKAVRHDIVAMVARAQSGHPGGSLGMAEVFALLFSQIVSQTGDPVVVSNGHVSPVVYATLAAMGYVSREAVVSGFRAFGEPYEGHVTRHVPGVWYGTGPLGAGAGAASGMALSYKLQGKKAHIFCTIGDGEAQEGEVYEMMHVAAKYKLDNLVVLLDYNQVQLSDSLDKVMPYNPAAHFAAAGWQVIEADGHDLDALWSALTAAVKAKGQPVCIVCKTIMGKGVPFMEAEGRALRATWHGKAPKQADVEEVLEQLSLSKNEEAVLVAFQKNVAWHPEKPRLSRPKKVAIKKGRPIVYKAGVVSDCRSAYGAALLDLAKRNEAIVAWTADLAGSVKTDGVAAALPDQHIDVGVAEQEMVSAAGGMSLVGQVPFVSTFGAFMTSRAKDQARVNDINVTNVKMVATHCGLSVGEDGPTHQAIDDAGSMLGLLNTAVMEPADANQCDRMVRFIASTYGNVYMRMGRHALPVLTKENGAVLFDATYQYYYGRCDIVREGTDVTIAATGGTVAEAFGAWEQLRAVGISAEVVAVSSIKQFDKTLLASVRKTGRVVTVEDHTTFSGLASQLLQALTEEGITVHTYRSLGVDAYQLSGTVKQLYAAAKIDAKSIAETVRSLFVSDTP